MPQSLNTLEAIQQWGRVGLTPAYDTNQRCSKQNRPSTQLQPEQATDLHKTIFKLFISPQPKPIARYQGYNHTSHMAIGITSHVTHISHVSPKPPLTNSNKLPTPEKKNRKVPQTNKPQKPKLETQTPQSFTWQLRPFWRAREGEREKDRSI